MVLCCAMLIGLLCRDMLTPIEATKYWPQHNSQEYSLLLHSLSCHLSSSFWVELCSCVTSIFAHCHASKSSHIAAALLCDLPLDLCFVTGLLFCGIVSLSHYLLKQIGRSHLYCRRATGGVTVWNSAIAGFASESCHDCLQHRSAVWLDIHCFCSTILQSSTVPLHKEWSMLVTPCMCFTKLPLLILLLLHKCISAPRPGCHVMWISHMKIRTVHSPMQVLPHFHCTMELSRQ